MSGIGLWVAHGCSYMAAWKVYWKSGDDLLLKKSKTKTTLMCAHTHTHRYKYRKIEERKATYKGLDSESENQFGKEGKIFPSLQPRWWLQIKKILKEKWKTRARCAWISSLIGELAARDSSSNISSETCLKRSQIKVDVVFCGDGLKFEFPFDYYKVVFQYNPGPPSSTSKSINS